jgi:ribosome biogenesis GTPase
VLVERRELYRVHTGDDELAAEISGKLRHEARGPQDFPAVGDWVVVTTNPGGGRSTIHAVLPRKSKFSRKVAGSRTEE